MRSAPEPARWKSGAAELGFHAPAYIPGLYLNTCCSGTGDVAVLLPQKRLVGVLSVTFRDEDALGIQAAPVIPHS